MQATNFYNPNSRSISLLFFKLKNANNKIVFQIVLAFLLLTGSTIDPLNAQTIYVNDNSTTGDVYTTAIGNDNLGSGTATAPYATISKAIFVATAGTTIKVDAGIYSSAFTINKNLTVMGTNAGIPGYSARIAEAQIKDVLVTISGTGAIILDGFYIYQTTTTSGGTVTVSNTPAIIRNNIIERVGSTTGVIAIGVQTSAPTAVLSIKRNLFTGSTSGGLASGHKTWNSGIYLSSGGANTTVDSNQIQNCRTALNVDAVSTGTIISNNTFATNGTAISYGGTSAPAGAYSLAGNSFNSSGSTFNLSNVTATFRLNATNNTYNGVAAINMTVAQCFSLESTISHKLSSTGKNGLVTYQTGKLFKTSTTTIANNIAFASDNNSIFIAGGTITEAITINKPLKLYGANNNVNPNTTGSWIYNSLRAAESIISGNGITIASSNVEVNGFKITGITNGAFAIGSSTSNVTAYSNLVIANNWITSNTNVYPIVIAGSSGGLLYAGLQVINNRMEFNGGANITSINIQRAGTYTINGNYIDAATFHGISVDGYSTGTIALNKITNAKLRGIVLFTSYSSPLGIIINSNIISGCQAAIYVTTNSVFPNIGLQVTDNIIDENVGKMDINLGLIEVRAINSGITAPNIISRNIITMSGTFGSAPVGLSATAGGPATAAYGILMVGDMGSTNIINNVIDGGNVIGTAVSTSTNKGPGMTGIYLRNGTVDQSTGLAGALLIQNNDIKGLTTGITCFNTTTLNVDPIPVSLRLTVTNNSIVPAGNGFAIQTGTGMSTIAGTCNWYGSAMYANVAQKLSGNITYQPFLISGVDNDFTTIGFQPSPGVCSGYAVSIPTTGASAGVFTAISQTSMTIRFTKGNGLKRMIVARKSAATTLIPAEDQTYAASSDYGSGAGFDNGFIVYNDTGNSFTITNLEASSAYYFTIFEYNYLVSNIKYAVTLKYTTSTTTLQPDADNDGVADVDDAYPAEPYKAFNTNYPASTFGTLMFEDLWPAKGDYDFNDLVVDYRFNTVTNAANNVVEIQYTFVTRAIGGALHNAFAFQLDGINPNKITSVSGSKATDASWIALNANGTEAGNTINANILVYDDAYKLLATHGGYSFVNTDPNAPDSGTDTTRITVKFLVNGTAPSGGILNFTNFSSSLFNPYIIIGQVRGKEVHLSDRLPSAKMNTLYFGQEQDRTDPVTGKYFKTEDNLPWAININTSIPFTNEKTDFSAAYLKFIEWASSAGALSPTWYLNITGNRDLTKLILR